MEHRWGERITLRLPVRLAAASETIDRGILRNVSASGAFIETRLRLPILSLLQVELPLDTPVPAFVVRRTKTGIGVEWSEYSPEALERLLTVALQFTPELERPPATGTHPS